MSSLTALTRRSAVDYLRGRGLLADRDVLDGDLAVRDRSRRNTNFDVTTAGPSYFVKQASTAAGAPTIEREAQVYEYLHRQAASVRRLIPKYFGVDVDRSLLVVESFHAASTLRERYATGRFSRRLAEATARALAAIHRCPSPPAALSAPPPWVLSIHLPTLEWFFDASHANMELLAIVQRHEYGTLLHALRIDWRGEALVHHDIKWDNLLVVRGGPNAAPALRVVDWELAGIGDACWDVGAVLAAYLGSWLLSIPITGQTPPERYLGLARAPLDRMRPAIGAFWRRYRTAMDLDAATAECWLVRCVAYSGARLLQTAFEQMQMSSSLTSNVVCMLQLGLNVLRRPDVAASQLLGLR